MTERSGEKITFRESDIDILKGLRSGKQIDQLLDEADLRGNRYSLCNLRTLKTLAEQVAMEDVVDKIPKARADSVNVIKKKYFEGCKKYDYKILNDRIGISVSSLWASFMGEDMNIRAVRKIAFGLGISLEELLSVKNEDE